MSATLILSALGQLKGWLDTWLGSRKERSDRERQALQVLLDALTKTQIYLGDLDSGVKRNRKRETELAQAWSSAAGAFAGVDKQVAPLFQMKSEAWARPELWSDERIISEQITIEEIADLANRLLAGDRPVKAAKEPARKPTKAGKKTIKRGKST